MEHDAIIGWQTAEHSTKAVPHQNACVEEAWGSCAMAYKRQATTTQLVPVKFANWEGGRQGCRVDRHDQVPTANASKEKSKCAASVRHRGTLAGSSLNLKVANR